MTTLGIFRRQRVDLIAYEYAANIVSVCHGFCSSWELNCKAEFLESEDDSSDRGIAICIVGLQ